MLHMLMLLSVQAPEWLLPDVWSQLRRLVEK
jgi:hypothetical protein